MTTKIYWIKNMKRNYKFFTEIFSPLGFVVFNRNIEGEDSPIYDLFIKSSERGLEWFGSFTYYIKNKTIYYNAENGNIYSKKEELINAINEINAKRPYPSYCYDPQSRPSYNLEKAYNWYMANLGFTDDDSWGNNWNENIKVLKNIYGETITKISLKTDYHNDNYEGVIYRSINGSWSWMESKFNSIESMFAAINSIVEPEILINAANALNISSKMTNKYNDIDFVKVDSSLNIYKMNAKNAIKNALENALNTLKENE